MTKTCAARHRDRFGTIHDCGLSSDHGGYHHTSDGLMFYDEEAVRLRRVPVRAERYLGKTGAVREIVEVVPREECSGLEWAPCTVRFRPGSETHNLFPGQWVVLFDDGHIEIVDDDRFRQRFECAGES